MATAEWKHVNRDRLCKYRRDHYTRNARAYKDRAISRRAELVRWYLELRQGKVCSSCGEDHPACIDFHHRDENKKELDVSKAVRYGWSKERILKEVVKCDVLCANCHRKLHWMVRHQPSARP
jgi:hypothetical protein